MTVDGETIPAGTTGTVVWAHDDGIGYDIELETPRAAVVTLRARDLLPA